MGDPITTGAVVIGGASLVGGLLASEAAESAGEAQASAARYAGDLSAQAQAEATAETRRQYDLSRSDLAPWREAGTRALGTLESLITAGPGEYTESPGYAFRLSEGQKTLERGAAAKGNLLGGAAQKALVKYGQDYATLDYDNFLNRYYQSLTPYQTLAGYGQNATNTGVTAGLNTANTISNILQTGASTQGAAALSGGQARGSQYINQANAITGSANSGLGNYFAWQNYNNQNAQNQAILKLLGGSQSPYAWGGSAQGF